MVVLSLAFHSPTFVLSRLLLLYFLRWLSEYHSKQELNTHYILRFLH